MLSITTPSKINLFLTIIGKRKDGYHNIKTIFVPLWDINDKVTMDFDFKPGITLHSKNKSFPLDETNLCHKAAKLYSEEAAISPSWRIEVEKNIPIAAGMGGGSSDAAAVLLLLQKQFNALPKEKISKIAKSLGADVPYFLNPVPAIGQGVGEKLSVVELKEGLYTVILASQFPVSAAWAYKNYKKPVNVSIPFSNNTLYDMKTGNWSSLATNIHNDLAFALYEKFPILNILKKELTDAGSLCVEITGSGPTLFGLCKNRKHAEKVLEKINPEYKETFYCGISKIG